MSKLSPLVIALSAATLFASAAQAQTTERTRADVIAELKAAQESGEQQAMALRMEGVGHVVPKPLKREETMFAKNKASKKAADKADAPTRL